jgi:hypothetical protein
MSRRSSGRLAAAMNSTSIGAADAVDVIDRELGRREPHLTYIRIAAHLEKVRCAFFWPRSS